MASIAKLAVILSAVTKPLEDGLKAADAKVKTFGHGFKEGLSIGAGVLGIDKVEQAMKKALAANEELGEAAEKVELAFGRTLISVTGMAHWLPRLAKDASGFADRVEEGFVWQEIKENAIWFLEWSKRFNADRAEGLAQASRAEFIKNKLAEKAAERLKELERKRFEEAREAAWVQMAGTEAQAELLKELENKNAALMTDAEKLARVRDEAPNSSKITLINYEMRKNQELELRKKNEEDLKKLMEDGKNLTESMFTPLEKLAAEQAKYNDMLAKSAITTDTYNRAIKALTPGLKDLEAIQAEIYKLDKGDLAAKVKEMTEAGASKDTIEQYKKLFDKLERLKEMKELEKADDGFGEDRPARTGAQFTGAAEAGSAAAYSSLVRAEAARTDAGLQGSDLLGVNKKQFDVQFKQFQLLQQMYKQQGDAIKAAESGIKLAKMSISGGG